jgi:hypothetical protein
MVLVVLIQLVVKLLVKLGMPVKESEAKEASEAEVQNIYFIIVNHRFGQVHM